MNKFVRVIGTLLVLVLLFGTFQTVDAGEEVTSTKVRVLVEFAPGSKRGVENALSSAGGEIHFTFDDLNTIAVSLPNEALSGIMRNPNVIAVEEDVKRFPIDIMPSESVMPLSVPLPNQVVPYGVDMVQARDVWDVNRDGAVDSGAPTGSNRTICIIDSGMYNAHEDLKDVNVAGGYTTISGGYLEDGLGHGTHVAGTITAYNNALGVIGVTPGTVNLYIVRVFGNDGSWAYASTLIDAANRCASAGANIISMSLGGGRSSRTERLGFDNLYSQGILPIAAAGNDGTTAVSYPAGYTSVVSVAAIDENKVVADFSQKNADVELAAPGVGVLSTVPYVDVTRVYGQGFDISGGHIDYSARGSATGALIDGGLCLTAGSWSGKVVLCQRGDISFYDKVINVQNGGGVAAIIYNNVTGDFLGTLGEGYSSNIIGISLSQANGLYLLANQLGKTATVESTSTYPASGYEYYDGTSMATPHVSAVAALVWSADPTASNAKIREALTGTAQDLGTVGRDDSYGYGLVQAKAAITYLVGDTPVDPTPTPTPEPTPEPTPTPPPATGFLHISDLDGSYTIVRSRWNAIITIEVKDEQGVKVSGATVSGVWSDGYTGTANCVTGSTGTCEVTAKNLKLTVPSVTFSVSGVTLTGYNYNPTANSDPDGNSNGTVIVYIR